MKCAVHNIASSFMADIVLWILTEPAGTPLKCRSSFDLIRMRDEVAFRPKVSERLGNVFDCKSLKYNSLSVGPSFA
jgi:hypothetical protein